MSTGQAGNRVTVSNYQPEGRQRAGLAARNTAAAILEHIIDRHQTLDSACDENTGYSRYRALIAKDRALIRAILVTALRHRGRIEFILSRALDRKPPQKARHLLHVLHVAAAQILYMDIPDSAAVNLAVTALREDRRSARFAPMANAVLRRLGREKEELLAAANAWQLAFPQWLAGRIRRDFGQEKAAAIATMVAREPILDLTLKPAMSDAKRDRLIADLGGVVVPTGSVRVASRIPVEQLPYFGEGLWWVQDAASSLPAKLLGRIEGLEIADLCAAPGGKTAQLVAGGARVTSVDISRNRLNRLRENLSRLQLHAEVVQSDILDWNPGRLYDAILLDAPCSSTGTIRRHPDVMWTKTEADIDQLAALQSRLIVKAASLLRKDGLLVYANCSLLKQEGEDLVPSVSSLGCGLEVVPLKPGEISGIDTMINRQGALRTLPCDLPDSDIAAVHFGGMDGFFAIRFRKIAQTREESW